VGNGESRHTLSPFIKTYCFPCCVDLEDIQNDKEWLTQKGIEIKTDFGFPPEKQPLVLPNNPHAHATIYFQDPDGNSLEFIAPLRLDVEEDFPMMTLEDWFKQNP
jgi:hypothetical protein